MAGAVATVEAPPHPANVTIENIRRVTMAALAECENANELQPDAYSRRVRHLSRRERKTKKSAQAIIEENRTMLRGVISRSSRSSKVTGELAAAVATLIWKVTGVLAVLGATTIDAGWTVQVAVEGAPTHSEKVTFPLKLDTRLRLKVAVSPAETVCTKLPFCAGVIVKESVSVPVCIEPVRAMV